MNNIGKARKATGLSQKQVALTVGVSGPTVSEWESGKKFPAGKNLMRLAELFSCTTDYLLNQTNTVGPPTPKGHLIPVLGSIPAGIPMEAVENIEDWEEIDPDMLRGGREYFALRLKGDSMAPRYQDKDVVIFLKAEDCNSGDKCAVIINGEDATFKTVVKQENGLVLQPLNMAYQPIFYSNSEIEDLPVRIIGVAKELRGKI